MSIMKPKNYFPGGLAGGKYKTLTDEEIMKIHKAAMAVFENTGMEINNDRILKMFNDAGAEVDFKNKIVKAKEDWILEKLSSAPESITLYGRDEQHDMILDGFNVYLGSGGTATSALDLDTGEIRPSVLEDVQKVTKLIDVLENIHYFIVSCYPNDLEDKNADVNRFYAALRNTSKHVVGGIFTKEGVGNIVKMAEMIAGSKEALIKKPFISLLVCITSPLVLDEENADIIIEAIESGLPLILPTAPMAGSTSPGSLAGTLVQMIVESLSGVLITQIMNPGHPVFFSCVPTTSDLRTGSFCYGSIEMGLMNAACAQISRFYKLPNYTSGGINESKIPDMQAGYESMATALLNALSGCNLVQGAAGLLESGLTISYEQYVIDNDILGMCMRAVKGIEINDETLAVDVINETGPGGNYLCNMHTISNMKNEFFYNKVSNRQTRSAWEDSGSFDTAQRANAIAKDILANHKTSYIDDETEKKILETIPGMAQNWID